MTSEHPGRIEFGGRITRTQWDEIVRRQPFLADLDPVTGQVDRPAGEDFVVIREIRLLSGIYIHDSEWGHFDELESYLREQGIPYDRGCNAEEASFRPGMENEFAALATQEGIVMSAETVLDYLGNGLTLADALGHSPCEENAALRLVALRRKDPLPPFVFVEE